MANVPLVNFKALGLSLDRTETVDDGTIQHLVEEVKSALTSSGFMYLTNHGIDESTIGKAFATACRFFELPETVKQKCKFNQTQNNGWLPLRANSADPGVNVDIVESLSFHHQEHQDFTDWPLDDVPSLRGDLDELYQKCHLLTLRILSVISLATGKEKNFLEKFHRRIGQDGNRTVAVAFYYPPVSDQEAAAVSDGQLRRGVHTDYGCITLLFQDDIGGLEVWDKKEETFQPAVPIPGTIIVNIGDALQRWTADQLVSNKHRVTIPASRNSRQRARQSIAYFVHPDEDVMLTCVDGSDKYPPISAGDYLDSKFNAAIISK